MVTRLDTDTGRLLALLKELGLDEKTLVIFTGDNGSSFAPNSTLGRLFEQAANGLRGYKRELYEGGLRNAGIIRWPGTVPAGRVSDEPWAFWDFLPTCAELAGAKIPAGVHVDSLSLVSFLKGAPAPKREYFYWGTARSRVAASRALGRLESRPQRTVEGHRDLRSQDRRRRIQGPRRGKARPRRESRIADEGRAHRRSELADARPQARCGKEGGELVEPSRWNACKDRLA
ncbi:MAG: sulfatase-like hydrolase/transferase [Chthoniobacteraceae bacterium]